MDEMRNAFDSSHGLQHDHFREVWQEVYNDDRYAGVAAPVASPASILGDRVPDPRSEAAFAESDAAMDAASDWIMNLDLLIKSNSKILTEEAEASMGYGYDGPLYGLTLDDIHCVCLGLGVCGEDLIPVEEAALMCGVDETRAISIVADARAYLRAPHNFAYLLGASSLHPYKSPLPAALQISDAVIEHRKKEGLKAKVQHILDKRANDQERLQSTIKELAPNPKEFTLTDLGWLLKDFEQNKVRPPAFGEVEVLKAYAEELTAQLCETRKALYKWELNGEELTEAVDLLKRHGFKIKAGKFMHPFVSGRNFYSSKVAYTPPEDQVRI